MAVFWVAVSGWLYHPRGARNAVPWIIVLGILPVLAVLGAPHIDEIKALPVSSRPLLSIALICGGVFLNGSLFWFHVGGAFLTWCTARRRYMTTLVLLHIWMLLWAAIAFAIDGTAFPAVGAGSRVDVRLTLACLGSGIYVLTSVLLFSELWREKGVDIAGVLDQRRAALAVAEILDRNQTPPVDAYRGMVSALARLHDEAGALAGRLDEPDTQLAHLWAVAADSLHYETSHYPADEQPTLRDAKQWSKALRELRQDYP